MELQNIRKLKKKSMQEIADIIGVSKATISLMEKGKIKLSLERAEKIANILGCRVSDIVGETKFDNNFKKIDFVKIPLFQDALKDRYNQEYFKQIGDTMQFDKSILENSDITEMDYSKLLFVKMIGDTMQPLISHDDNVLISLEVSKETIRSNRMYLINENGRLSIKRIMRENPMSDDIIIKDDNETSNNYNKYTAKISEWPDDFLIGRVIYIGKRIY